MRRHILLLLSTLLLCVDHVFSTTHVSSKTISRLGDALHPTSSFSSSRSGNGFRMSLGLDSKYFADMSFEQANAAKKKKSVCTWKADSEEHCVPSSDALTRMFKEFNSSLSTMVARFTTCRGQKSKKACTKTDFCLWDSHADYCFFGQFDLDQFHSPCLNASRGFSTIVSRRAPCAAENTKKECLKDPACTWNGHRKTCRVDPFLALYGISLKRYQKIMDAMAHHISELVQERYNVSDPSFEWQAVFDTEIPESTCTDIADKESCNFTLSLSSVVLRRAIYCQLRYGSHQTPESCARDPLCEYDGSEKTCKEKTTLYVLAIFVEESLPYMKSPVDKQIMRKVLDCGTSIRMVEYCTDTCSWNEQLGFCSMNDSWAYGQIAAAEKPGENDPYCAYFSAYANSGCGHIDDPEICNSKQNCQWNQADLGCDMTVDFVVDEALKKEPTLVSDYDALVHKCSRFKKKKQCHGPKLKKKKPTIIV